MRPIDDYIKLVARKRLKEYLAEDPPAVLLTDVLCGSFRPIQGKPGDTAEMQAFCNGMEEIRNNRTTSSSSYVVMPLAGGQGTGTNRLLVGCSERCDIRVSEVTVSREHAWIERKGDKYFIEDNNSTNGTSVNGVRLEPGQARRIQTWSRITLGKLDLTFFDPRGFYNFVKKFGSG